MNISRRSFLGTLGFAGAAVLAPGCTCKCCGPKAKVALQLYSINRYIGKVGFAKALADVAAIGYTGVEFAGYGTHTPEELRKMLADNGLVVCGTHVGNNKYGFKIDAKEGKFEYDAEILKKTCEFELAYGNSLIICPGGGNMPPGASWGMEQPAPTAEKDEFIKRLADLYNKAAKDAATMGCRIGLHNHMWEHAVKMQDGTSYWNYFFSNTDKAVCMEQDVGWSACAGEDPCAQYTKYPGRSPTLHAKENGMGPNVKKFDAILGKPGMDENGKVVAVGVDWDKLIVASEADGVKWYVVECERHQDDLTAVTPSYAFLKEKGLK